jgi:2-polyprenyl-3-methyl-5-hydroxy-6-metoxy-1,4-benzoquinol methylase
MANGFVARPTCEVCGSGDGRVLISRPFTDPAVWGFLNEHYGGRVSEADVMDVAYELVECAACGFIWQVHVPDERLALRLYDEWISPEESLASRAHADPALYRAFAWQLRGVASLLGRRPSEVHVLDFGAGWGQWCLTAKRLGYDVKGVEISPRRIEYARGEGVDVVADLDELGDWRADYVNAEQVFEHIARPVAVLGRLRDVLSDGGIVRLSVPNAVGVARDVSSPHWRARKDAVQPLEHISCYRPSVLRSVGERAGLRVLRRPGLVFDRARWRAGVRALVGAAYRALLRIRGRRTSHVVHFIKG